MDAACDPGNRVIWLVGRWERDLAWVSNLCVCVWNAKFGFRVDLFLVYLVEVLLVTVRSVSVVLYNL